MSAEVDRLDAVAKTIADHKAALVKLTAERDRLIRALAVKGLTLREIGAVAGISHVSAGRIVNGGEDGRA